MNNLNDIVYANKLLDTYGCLLTDSQYHICDLYYRFNLSISEIAEEKGVSRAAVNDTLKKSSKILNNYEEKLHNIKRKEIVIKLLNNIENEKDETKQKSLIEGFIKEYLE